MLAEEANISDASTCLEQATAAFALAQAAALAGATDDGLHVRDVLRCFGAATAVWRTWAPVPSGAAFPRRTGAELFPSGVAGMRDCPRGRRMCAWEAAEPHA